MTEILLPIKNFPKQQSIFESKARVALAAKGRRFGLTKGAANDFIKSALEGKFSKGLWVDVVNGNIDKYIERYFLPHLNKLPSDMWNWRVQKKELHIGKAYIDFRSADKPETMEGFGYDKAFINEAGIVLKNEYLWNNAIQPMFWDYPNVKIVIGGTPKGKGKFYELCQRGKDPEQTDFEFFTFTSFDNPFINLEAIKADMANMPERVVKQEIYAEFLDDTGVVFRGFKEIADSNPLGPLTGHSYVIGVDVAKVQDWTVLAVYDRGTNKQVYQARFNQLEWPVIQNRIAATAKHYNNAVVIIDSTGVGEAVFDGLSRNGIAVTPYKFTNESKKQLIEKLANWIELKQIRILNISETIEELTNFTYDISETTGRIHYEAPVGFHDDIVIAHALAVWELNPLYKEVSEKPKTLIQLEYAKAQQDNEANYIQELNEWGAEYG